MVAVADRVYAVDMLGLVYALDSSDGAFIWQRQLDGPIWTTPALSGIGPVCLMLLSDNRTLSQV